LALAERANPALRGPEQDAWLKRLEVEHDNLRAALELSIADAGDAEAGPRLAWALFWFWQRSGHIGEGREWLERMVARASGVSALVRARVLCGAGALAEHLAEYDQARARLEESLTLFRQLDDPWGAGFALHFLAHVARAQGDFPQATSLFEKSLASFQGMGDKWGSALTLDCWGGALINQGDRSGAARRYEQSVTLLREVGDKWQIPGPLSGLGVLAAASGDYVRATALLEESLAMARETLNSDSGATTLFRMGRALFWQGDLARAAALFKDSLALRKQRADKAGIAACLDGLAGVAAEGERFEAAARLFGAAQALREAIRNPVAPAQRAEYDRQVATVRTTLDEETLAAAWAVGRAMTLDEAIEYALSLEAPPPAGRSGDPAAGTGEVAVLTPREREVAALIANGLTNREIAARLVVADRTAEGHVQSILNKLGFNTRAQIAVWAVEHGLRLPLA
jgi:DNA-binding CsgD family transcriptional regulator/tetratricopeptide (TPR) repeat protein